MTEIFYFNKEGKPCEKEEAVTLIIRETDEAGKILETFGSIEK